jgi:thiamine biosynthesis lipoprotein
MLISRRKFVAAGARVAALACAGAGAGVLAGCANPLTAMSGATHKKTTYAGSTAEADASSDTFDNTENSTGGASDELRTATFFAFDTVITINAYATQAVMDELQARCEFFEQTFSRTVEGSDIWRVNEAGGAAVAVEPETVACVQRALEFSQLTGGLFDVTIGAVSRLWDFVEGVRPTDAAIDAALPHINWQGVSVDEAAGTITLADTQAALDLGGIAKGYISDDLCALMAARGVSSAVVNLGGNVAVVGTKPDGSQWRVGVQDPNGQASDVVAALTCADTSVITSGLYERQFSDSEGTWWHILDPRTGRPVATDLASSSVVSADGAAADALATAFFLMGRAAAYEWLEANPQYQALLVDAQGNIAQTSNSQFEIL